MPSTGFGKSRLAAAVGLQSAFELASAFVQDTLRLLESRPWQRVVAVTPPEATMEVAATLEANTVVVAQVDGDLGDRIVAALDCALESATRAVLIGSDTPDLSPEVVERAFAALDEADIVLGPASDGGFYLLGVHETYPDMFANVEWSTATVCARTVANIEALDLRVALIETWHDVDNAASLWALARRLEAPAMRTRAPATRAALATVREVAVA